MRFLNSVSISSMAKKIMVEEWRRALGKPERDSRLEKLKAEAVVWKEKQEQEKELLEEAEKRFLKLKRKVEGVLADVGQKLIEEKKNITLEKANRIIENLFWGVGKIYHIQWRSNGCDIWIELWKSRKFWQKGKEPPFIYKLQINEELEVDSYSLEEDEKVIATQKEGLLERQLATLFEGEGISGRGNGEIGPTIKEKLEEVGRVVEFKEFRDKEWIAKVELWEEVRKRNIQGKKSPLVTEYIAAKMLKDKLVVFPLRNRKEKKNEC